MGVVVIVGTAKGAFVLRSSNARQEWKVEGPLFKGWKVTAIARAADGTYLAGTASDVYGPAIQKSSNLRDWRQVEKSPQYPEGGKRKLNQIWSIVPNGKAHYAGVDEAGLFRSIDRGETWEPVTALNEHPTSGAGVPGAGGLCLHSIIVDPRSDRRIWCGISAVGVFRSDDGGETWHAKNEGVPVIVEDKEFKDIGFCVHAIAQDPKQLDTIYRQDHRGMFRSSDRGDRWQRIENGLPSGYGFPLALDPRTRALFSAPLESDEYRIPIEGRFAVYRSRDGGESWHPAAAGLPERNAYFAVLRRALAVDGLDPCGVYCGTTSGTIYASNNCGDRWQAIPCVLPRILTVAAFTEN